MSTNERKQANFSVSHVWPEMIDIKCCNCKKFSESLKNGEFEKSGEKSYIIKSRSHVTVAGHLLLPAQSWKRYMWMQIPL